MNFEELESFIHDRKKMKMTYIYQPVMIKALLEAKGKTATVDEIARKFLNNDESELEHYRNVTKKYPQNVLAKHKVVSVKDDTYTLRLDKKLSKTEEKRLIELCNLRLDEFIDKDKLLKELYINKPTVPDDVKDRVILKSRGACVGCGNQVSGALLQIDHDLPVFFGGKSDIDNLRTLCRKCSDKKRKHDKIDFLNWGNRLKESRKNKCMMCSMKNEGTSNGMAHSMIPNKPDTDTPILVAPRRHVRSFKDLTQKERQMCIDLIDEVIRHTRYTTSMKEFAVTGFDRKSDHFHIDIVPLPTPRQRRQ